LRKVSTPFNNYKGPLSDTSLIGSIFIDSRAVPDPAIQVNPDLIQIQGFDDQKLKKKYRRTFFVYLVLINTVIAIYFMSKLQKKPSALKREQPALHKMNFFFFFSTFVGHFCPPGSGSGSRDPIESGYGSGSTTLIAITGSCVLLFFS
jgi:hypothetical protein